MVSERKRGRWEKEEEGGQRQEANSQWTKAMIGETGERQSSGRNERKR